MVVLRGLGSLYTIPKQMQVGRALLVSRRCPAAVAVAASGFRETLLFHLQTRPKFTSTAGGESCCGAVGGYVGEGPSKPLRAWHGARLRPLLAWELLGGPARLGSTLAVPLAPALAATHSSPRRSRPLTAPRGAQCWC